MIALSDAGRRRLVHYCRRERVTESELVELHGRSLSYVGSRLRRLVWGDTEVRGVLLVAADDRAVWDQLVSLLAARGASGFSLLDLVTALSFEAGLVDRRGGPP
jgi:hypothetical protein